MRIWRRKCVNLAREFKKDLTYVFTMKKYNEWRRRNGLKGRDKRKANGRKVVQAEGNLGVTSNGVYVVLEWCKCISK